VTAFSRLLENPRFFLENFRTWKVLEKYSWKLRIFIASDGEQAAIVYHSVSVDCCLLKYFIQQFIFLLALLA